MRIWGPREGIQAGERPEQVCSSESWVAVQGDWAELGARGAEPVTQVKAMVAGAPVGEHGGWKEAEWRKPAQLSSFSGGSTGDKVISLEAKLEKQQLELRAGLRPPLVCGV